MDIQNAIEIYSNAFNNLTASAQKSVASPQFDHFTAVLADHVNNSVEGVYATLQAPLLRSIEYITIGELIESAPLAMQRQLDTTAMSKLISDKVNGFAERMPLLLELPQVVRYSTCELSLNSGNHRLALIVNAALHGGATDIDDVLAQKIQVLVTSIDNTALSACLANFAGEASVVNLTAYQFDKMADDVLNRIWHTANGSRTVSSEESKGYITFNKFPRTVDGISSALQQGEISLKDTFSLMSVFVARQVNPLYEGTASAQVFPADLFVNAVHSSMRIDTVAKILNSAYGKAVTKDYSKAVKASGMLAVTAILKEVLRLDSGFETLALVQLDKTAPDGSYLTETQPVPCSMFQAAIDNVVKRLIAEGDKMSTNVAYNASKVGAELASLLHTTSLFDNYAKAAAQPKATPVKSTMWKL
jgi:hypothetical protein